jgi:hypothetical protein
MRPALLALPALVALALPAMPAQAALLTEVTGAGLGVASFDGCSADVAIAFHLDFNGLGALLFPQDICDGWNNNFVEDCQQTADGIQCIGSADDGGLLTVSHDGDFHYEVPYKDGVFAVDGQVVFNQVVVPAFV